MVSGALATTHATRQREGNKHRMAGTFPYNHCLCLFWQPHFSGEWIQFWCNNKSVVTIINTGHSKAPRTINRLRFFVLIFMRHNSYVTARHVRGVYNEIADALSRFQDTLFRAGWYKGCSLPWGQPPWRKYPESERGRQQSHYKPWEHDEPWRKSCASWIGGKCPPL